MGRRPRPHEGVGCGKKRDLIEWVWKKYGSMSGEKLSALTHEKGTPWYKAVQEMFSKNGGRFEPNWIISNDSIRDHYRELWMKSRNATTHSV